MSTDWRARVLQHLDEHAPEMLVALGDLVRIPSVTGTSVENDGQAEMARRLTADGFDIDYWQIDLDEIQAEDDFPGMEVERDEAWGLVARLPGRGGGRSLMLNGHIDVVPPGDLGAWSTDDPYSGTVDSGRLFGRGACDMKAGLLAARFAMRSLRAVGVPLRGDVLLASVQGEEDGGLGTYSLLRRGWRGRRVCDPRADEPRSRAGERRRTDVPVARARSGDPCITADGWRERARAVLAGVAGAERLGGAPQP